MISKKDFIELEFTGRIKDTGQIFDTTLKEEAKKAGLDEKKCKPLKICVGEGMMLKSLDESLEGKEEGKLYHLDLEPEKAFGKRNPKLVKIVPRNVFEHEPQTGMLFSFDGALGKVVSSSSGRITVDFNNPLAGKTVSYSFKIIRKINDKSEKISVLAYFLLGIEDAKIDSENKLIVPAKFPKEAVEMFEKKAKELLGAEIDVEKK